MRKLRFVLVGLLVVMFGFSVVHGCRESNVLSKCRAGTKEAILFLQRQELTEGSVQACKDTIQNLNKKLTIEKEKGGGRLGRIHGQIMENEGVMFIVDKLVEYSKNPTEKDAEYLRAVARTDGVVQGLIIHFMDKQTNYRFKFEVSKP